jgi:hypothetical protein
MRQDLRNSLWKDAFPGDIRDVIEQSCSKKDILFTCIFNYINAAMCLIIKRVFQSKTHRNLKLKRCSMRISFSKAAAAPPAAERRSGRNAGLMGHTAASQARQAQGQPTRPYVCSSNKKEASLCSCLPNPPVAVAILGVQRYVFQAVLPQGLEFFYDVIVLVACFNFSNSSCNLASCAFLCSVSKEVSPWGLPLNDQ